MDLKKLKMKYEKMDRLQLQDLLDSYDPDKYDAVEKKIIEETFIKYDVRPSLKRKTIKSNPRSFFNIKFDDELEDDQKTISDDSKKFLKSNSDKRSFLKYFWIIIAFLLFLLIKNFFRHFEGIMQDRNRENELKNRLPGYPYKHVE